MSSLCQTTFSSDYVDAPNPDDFVHAELLKATINGDVQDCINSIIGVLNSITGIDDKLLDESVRVRMLHPEVKDLFAGIEVFLNARLATTASVTLGGLQIIDGTQSQDGDLILVKDQFDASENGMYIASSGLWLRADPMIDGYRPGGVVYVWVAEGASNSYTSFIWDADDSSAEVGTTDQEWVVFHKEFQPTIDNDTINALQGTEGTPSDLNRFVTSTDPRLLEFAGTVPGLVPEYTGNICEFLCSDGTWKLPDAVILANVVRTDQTSTLEDDVQIILGGGLSAFAGLPDVPLEDDHAASKKYIDDLIAAIESSTLGPLIAWKDTLDLIDGILTCDGAGVYSAFNGVFDYDVTINGKLTVTGLIDPTGLQFDPVAANPGDPFTIWVDDSGNDLWFGALNLIAAIGQAGTDAAQALVDAANAQATADAAGLLASDNASKLSAIDAIDGYLVGDAAGNYSAGALATGAADGLLRQLSLDTSTFLRGDGNFAVIPPLAVTFDSVYQGSDTTLGTEIVNVTAAVGTEVGTTGPTGAGQIEATAAGPALITCVVDTIPGNGLGSSGGEGTFQLRHTPIGTGVPVVLDSQFKVIPITGSTPGFTLVGSAALAVGDLIDLYFVQTNPPVNGPVTFTITIEDD